MVRLVGFWSGKSFLGGYSLGRMYPFSRGAVSMRGLDLVPTTAS